MSNLQPIRFFCPSCAKKVVVPGEYAGRSTYCPKCNGAVTVPGMTTVQAPRPKRIVRKSSKLKPVLVGLSVVLIIGIAISATILVTRNGEDTKMAEANGEGGEANGEGEGANGEGEGANGGEAMPSEETIAKSVGMVICGFNVTSGGSVKEKRSLYMPIEKAEFDKLNDETKEKCYVFKDGTIVLRISAGGTGSCFVITEDGYAITNMHVVEDVNDFQKDSGILDGFAKRMKHDSTSATIWVALDGVVHPAKIIHVSSQYDCAVIKIGGLNGVPSWKLSKAVELKRDVEVATLGFPGASRGEFNAEEAAIQQAKSANAKSIRDFFLDSDFKYVQKKGSVSVVKARSGEGEIIDHTATINGGNSGGPLVRTGDGVVAGINTWHSNIGANTFLSIKIDSVKKEIDQFVPNVVWVE